MAWIQRTVLQLIGILYTFRVLWKLGRIFVRRPVFCIQSMRRKSHENPPDCLLNDIYGTHEFIKINGVKLHYVSKGSEDKPLMLFIHGYPDFWYAWRHQIEEFSKTYRTVAVDLRGFGESDKPKDILSYTTANFREDIVDLVKALNYKTCILVSHDIGGSIAYHVATKYPEIIDKMVVFNSPHPAVFYETFRTNKVQKENSWYMIFFQIPYFPEILTRCFDCALIREMCDGKIGSAKSDEDQEAYIYMYAKSGSSGQINFYRAVLGYGSADTRITSQIRVPCLLVWGVCDPFLLKDMAEMNRQYIPNINIKYFYDDGHWPHIDNPEGVNSAIHEFLDQKE